jgi:cytochrome c556
MPILKLSSLSLVAIAAVFALTACNEAIDTHPAQLVTKRRAIFKEFTRTLEPMGMVARDRKDYNPREFNVSALALGLFHPGQQLPADTRQARGMDAAHRIQTSTEKLSGRGEPARQGGRGRQSRHCPNGRQ